MPTFRTRQPGSLASGVRNLMSVNARSGLNDAEKIGIDRLAADAAHKDSLAEKVRLEVEQMRQADRLRNDPAAQTDYAANASGVPGGEPATNLSKFIRGISEQFAGPGTDEAGAVVPARDLPVARPDVVTPEQERAFRAARGSLMANSMATGKTNADQLTQAGGNLLTGAIRNEMTAPGVDIGRENQLGHAINIRSREPFKTNAQGTVLNEETGGLNEGSDLASAVRAATEALTGQRTAAGNLSNVRAGDITATQPSRIQRITNPVPRPAPQRTPGQEARDTAYARAQAARAAGSEAENLRTQQSRARRDFQTELRTDPSLRGTRLGRWVEGQGYEVKDDRGTVVGYYD